MPSNELRREVESWRQERAGQPGRATERMLLRAARTGDRRALDRLVGLLAPPVFRFGRTFCRNRNDAEDVMQETLAAMVRTLGSFRGDSSLSSWAFVVARNTCARMRRRRRNEELTIDAAPGAPAIEPVDPGPGPAEAFDRGALGAALGRALRSLPRSYREVVVLRDVEGLSAAEAARSLGIGEPALKSRLHRAREALRVALRDGAGTGAPPVAAPAPHRRGCPDLVPLLSRYLEGDLDRSVCAELEGHVSGCASCGAACDELLGSLALCRRAGTSTPPLRVRRAVREAIREALGRARERPTRA